MVEPHPERPTPTPNSTSADTAGSSSSPHGQPHRSPPNPQSPPPWWFNVPTIKIVRPAKGPYSPRADERCLTYCSQSASGRTQGLEPWCRSICIRRVFAHEVKKMTSPDPWTRFVHDPPTAGNLLNAEMQETQDLKYPLPHEGQSSSAAPDGIFTWPPSAADCRYWKEGWYVWMSKSRWAAQERLDLMMSGLEHQTWWQYVKEYEERAWLEREKQWLKDNGLVTGTVVAADVMMPPAVVPEDLRGQPHVQADRHPFSQAAQESILIPLPPAMPPVHTYVATLLAPTGKVLGIVQESFASGTQRQFAGRMWDTARSSAPFLLARNALRSMWEKWKSGPPEGSGTL